MIINSTKRTVKENNIQYVNLANIQRIEHKLFNSP